MEKPMNPIEFIIKTNLSGYATGGEGRKTFTELKSVMKAAKESMSFIIRAGK